MNIQRYALRRLMHACLLSCIVLFSGCAGFKPPAFTGELSKIETPLELPADPTGDFAFSENSTTKVKIETSFIGLYTYYQKGELRVSAAARSSVKPAGDGYVLAVNFNRISVRPVTGKSEAGYTVEDLGYTGFLNSEAKMVEFDVDKDSPGWSSLEMEQRKSIEQQLAKWKKRRDRRPRFPRTVEDGQQFTLDASLFAPDADSALPADYKLTGGIIFQFAGLTQFRERQHLLVNIEGKLQGKSRSKHMTMNGDVGGYMLIDVETGHPSFWEDGSRFRITTPLVTFTIQEKSEGELSKL